MSDIQFSTKINFPFLHIPRSMRFLSIKDERGNPKRLNSYHIEFLLYLQELPEHYKSIRTMEKDLGWSRTTICKIKKELQQPTIETNSPLIHMSEFRDKNNQVRHQIEVYPDHESLIRYDKILFNEEEGKAYRERWLDQWKPFEGGGGSRNGTPVVHEMDHGGSRNGTKLKEVSKIKVSQKNLPPQGSIKKTSSGPPDPIWKRLEEEDFSVKEIKEAMKRMIISSQQGKVIKNTHAYLKKIIQSLRDEEYVKRNKQHL